jgi:uncharacterized protein (UPF0303 family)
MRVAVMHVSMLDGMRLVRSDTTIYMEQRISQCVMDVLYLLGTVFTFQSTTIDLGSIPVYGCPQCPRHICIVSAALSHVIICMQDNTIVVNVKLHCMIHNLYY